MYKLRFRAFLIFLVACFVYAACRKTDIRPENNPSKNVVRFFNEHTTTNPLVAGAKKYLAARHAKTGFIQSLITANGFAFWDKSLVIEKATINQPQSALGSDPADIVYVPLVRTEENFVNASLIVKMTGTDTTVKILADWQYASYGFDTTNTANWNARDIFNIFSTLDRSVFGSTKFKITDGRIFGDSQQVQRIVTVNTAPASAGAGPSGGNLLSMVTLCNSWTVCIIAGASTPFHRNGTSTPGGVCNTYSYCTTVWVENGTSGSGGGGTGTGTGTGGGSGTGGGTGTGTGGTGGIGGTGGGGGWVAISEEPVPQSPSTMLKTYSKAIKTRKDSLMAISLQYNREYSMIIAKRRDSIYLKNQETSYDSLSTTVNFSIDTNEVILGYIHTHPSASANILDRSAPSGSDLMYLRFHLKTNFTGMAECGNATYALVIEDSAKAKIFLDSISRFNVDQRVRDSATRVSGWFSNWQNATQVALANLIGSASLHGIGFYKSTDPMRESWVKIN